MGNVHEFYHSMQFHKKYPEGTLFLAEGVLHLCSGEMY